MRLVGSGHAAITATHSKTLEFTPDAELTARASCVIAVGIRGEAHPMAGDVRITITAGDEAVVVDARANSGWDPRGSAVVRRSPFRLPGTFATHATTTARDLPRSLVRRLQDPDTTAEISVESVGGRRCAVLFALDPSRPGDPRLAAELAAADRVVAEDEDAARLVGRRVERAAVSVDGRVLVLATGALPGRTVAHELAAVDVETVGLSPDLAAAAAAASTAPVYLARESADARAVLRAAPADARVVLTVRATEVMATLRHAADARGAGSAVLVQGSAPPVRVGPDGPPELWSKDPVTLCFEPAADAGDVDPRMASAVTALLDDGVATKVAARAVAELTGWSRQRAYDYVLSRRPGPAEPRRTPS